MKKVSSVSTVIGLTMLVFWACGPSAKEKRKAAEASPDYVSSSAAVENNKDTVHRFVRTAELRFRVKHVEQTTYNIEDIVAAHSGFVTFTNLRSDNEYVTKDRISADSMLETTRFTVTNEMVIRVPNTQLDATLKDIAPLIDHLDYRVIKAEDVALDLLANQLAQRRIAKNEARVENTINSRGKKLGETYEAEENLLTKQEQADNAKIANLKLRDQINFSTVNISIYQRQTIKREIVADDSNLGFYEPGLGSRIWDGIKAGWKMIESILVFLVNLWAVLLIIVLFYVVYKRFRSKL